MRAIAIVITALIIMLQYDLWMGEGSMLSAWQLQHAIENQQADNEQLLERNNTLAAEVQDLKSGLDAVDERARTELGMIKKGETFVQIIEEREPPAP